MKRKVIGSLVSESLRKKLVNDDGWKEEYLQLILHMPIFILEDESQG